MRSIGIIVLAAVMAALLATSALAFGFDDQSYLNLKGVVGKPYTHTFAIRKGGGSPPYHYRILQNGKMPPGLTLGKDDGKVTGTPTEAGKWSVWIEGYDSGKAAGFWDMATQREFTFEILPALAIHQPKLTSAVAKKPYTVKLTADGGGKQAWSVVSGKLPAGISLADDGTLSGTPTAAGSFAFVLKVTDPEWDEYAVGVRQHLAGFRADSRTFTLNVAKPKLAIVTKDLPAAVSGVAYNARLTAEDEVKPVKWSIVNGKLPQGIGFDKATGTLRGTARATGNCSITFQAKDKQGAVAKQQLVLTVLTKEQAAVADREARTTRFNIKDHGAKGDGKTDDTAAIQRALDAAAKVQGVVVVPSGTFMCHDLKMPPHTGMVGNANWDYRTAGGSILSLNHAEKAKCLIDMTVAAGGTLNGLSLYGGRLGTNVHGVYYAPGEVKRADTTRIERCQIRKFTGDGIHIGFSSVFSIRHCEIKNNSGNAICLKKGYDGWILDNWLADSGKAGFAAEELNASVTITANRIEWNRGGGIYIIEGGHYNITGNYFDRCSQPSIRLVPRGDRPCVSVTITGNIFLGSGLAGLTPDDYSSSHIYIERASGIVVTGNTMFVGNADDKQSGSPKYGIVVKGLRNSVIMGNSLHVGATKQLIVDLGEHKENVIIKDNVGSVYTSPGPTWASPQW